MTEPRVAVVAYRLPAGRVRQWKGGAYAVPDAYVQAVRRAGMEPVIVPGGNPRAAREFLAHCKRYFNRQRCHRLNDDIADRRIECSAMDGLTKTVFAPLQWPPATPISWHTLIAMRVVADGHAFTAGSTDHQSLQQRRALACRPTVSFRAPGERVR